MNLLQLALNNGTETVASLQERYHIIVRTHPDYPNLYMFKYDQLNSPMSEPIVQLCRGIILDADKNWGVISFPFTKFFNEGEPLAANIDWSSARVQEKLDGSLMSLYYYAGKWHVASSGTPDAGGSVHDFPDKTFADLFWDTYFSNTTLGYPDGLEAYTFMFELMTPFNRVVVQHPTPKLILIGVRDNITQKELPVRHFASKFKTVKEFPLTSLDEVLESLKHFNGADQEGYVVVDEHFNRVKIKHPEYVALHHLKGNKGPTPKRMLGIMLSNESDEVLVHFPEFKPIYNDIKAKFDNTCATLDQQFKAIDPTLTQKEFAVHALKSLCPDALFKMRTGKIKSFQEYFTALSLDRAMEIVLK